MALDPETVERVRRYLGARDDVVEKRMVGGLSFMVGGRMCCGVTSTGLMVRLGRDGARTALGEPHVRPLELGGQPIDAFVVIDPAGYAGDAALARWLDRALAFVAGET
jgi:hypothetical protein